MSRKFLLPFLLVAFAPQALAVHWTSSQTGPSTWTYTLTYDPQDNYDISISPTTITMTGLYGVTAAGAPTSTDYSDPGANTTNLAWTPQVTNGGTTVVWSIAGGGTGNYPTAKHVYGFSITAPGAANGSASFATHGFQVDSNGPMRDTSGTVAGPSATATSVPAASGLTLLLLAVSLGVSTRWMLRKLASQS